MKKWCEVGAHEGRKSTPAVAQYVAFGGTVKGLCGGHAFHVQDTLGERAVTWYGTPDGREPR